MNDQRPTSTAKNDSAEQQSEDRNRRPANHSDEPRRRKPSATNSNHTPDKRPSSEHESSSGHEHHEETPGEQPKGSRSPSNARPEISAGKAVKSALEQFVDLTRRQPESVVGVKKSGEGWVVRLEVVESRRIPDTADLLAIYEVDLDAEGDIVAYDRKDRYVRGHPSD
ncbi:gas vesicle protein GvpO [Rothia uropygialis]|uniref:gas vesicle protein GvpO n=1 Tax=Kocuria sp. 36 TaxID=1415402 RepID=UPI00101DAB17|nr:gas vesicle protein [Kocuria sp. 36]